MRHVASPHDTFLINLLWNDQSAVIVYSIGNVETSEDRSDTKPERILSKIPSWTLSTSKTKCRYIWVYRSRIQSSVLDESIRIEVKWLRVQGFVMEYWPRRFVTDSKEMQIDGTPYQLFAMIIDPFGRKEPSYTSSCIRRCGMSG